ncbi:MAG TPA: YetF domain-containing protein [Burkholderiaceae bacterium]|nr:YetF domain-containing protein [Burkholderiaceae bacterium]
MAINPHELFALSMPWAEIVLRGSAMYWFLFLLFRLVLRRDVGSIGIADVLLIVLLADASQNAMAGEYKSITDGMVLVTTLVAWNQILNYATYMSPKLARLFEPPPLRLIHHGKVLHRNLRREFLTLEELRSHLRQKGIEDFAEVKHAFMESDGNISVIRQKNAE